MPVRPRQQNLRRAPPRLFQVFNEVRAKKAHLKGIGDIYNHHVEEILASGATLRQHDHHLAGGISCTIEEILQLHKEVKAMEDRLKTLSCLYKYPLEPTLCESTEVYRHLPRRDVHLIDEAPAPRKARLSNAKRPTKSVEFVEPMEELKEVWRIRAGHRDGIQLQLMANKIFFRTGKQLSNWLGEKMWANMIWSRRCVKTAETSKTETVQPPAETNPLKRVLSDDADDTDCHVSVKRRKISHDQTWPAAYVPYDIFADTPCNILTKTDEEREEEETSSQPTAADEQHPTEAACQPEPARRFTVDIPKAQKRRQHEEIAEGTAHENPPRVKCSVEIYNRSTSDKRKRRRSYRLAAAAAARPLSEKELNIGTIR